MAAILLIDLSLEGPVQFHPPAGAEDTPALQVLQHVVWKLMYVRMNAHTNMCISIYSLICCGAFHWNSPAPKSIQIEPFNEVNKKVIAGGKLLKQLTGDLFAYMFEDFHHALGPVIELEPQWPS